MIHCSYKQVCLTMTFLVALADSSFLHDTSWTVDHQSALPHRFLHQRSRRSNNADRFGDEFFLNDPMAQTGESETSLEAAATADDPPRYEIDDNTEGCERIVKNSMICMLCKDRKSNSKYEQCSYVASPRVAVANDNDDDDDDDDDDDEDDSGSSSRLSSYNKSRADGVHRGGTMKREPKYDENESSNYQSQYDGSSSHEQQVRTPVKHDDDDGSSENDEENIYTNSNKYNRRYSDNNEDRNYHQSKYEPENEKEHSSRPFSPVFRSKTGENDSSRNNKRINLRKSMTALMSKTAKVIPTTNGKKQRNNNCQRFKKDSMTCTICADPETGENSEKCSYAHQPNDKLYKFSKSRSFGYPDDVGSAEQDDSSVESE